MKCCSECGCEIYGNAVVCPQCGKVQGTNSNTEINEDDMQYSGSSAIYIDRENKNKGIYGILNVVINANLILMILVNVISYISIKTIDYVERVSFAECLAMGICSIVYGAMNLKSEKCSKITIILGVLCVVIALIYNVKYMVY